MPLLPWLKLVPGQRRTIPATGVVVVVVRGIAAFVEPLPLIFLPTQALSSSSNTPAAASAAASSIRRKLAASSGFFGVTDRC